jgi:bla regulator protein blaR1
MRTRFKRAGYGRKLSLKSFLLALTSAVCMLQLAAQSPNPPAPYWQTVAGGQMAFDVVTVRQNTTAPPFAQGSNFPLGPGDVYVPNGGSFRAKNFPLITYIEFAYKISDNQEQSLLSQLPKWAINDRFDIQGTAQGNPTKDQMRLMMQAVLADRFHLAVHYETRQVPILALVVDHPGKLGPLLQRHADDSPCATTPAVPSPAPTAPPQFLDTRFPATCGGIVRMPPSAAGRVRSGARNVSMELIASSIGQGGDIDRPVVDKTGLTGMFDVAIEFTPQLVPSSPPDANSHRDLTGPTFQEALRDQNGLRLEPQMGPIDFLVVSYVEEPSPN